jgi:hypothetical protein
MSTSLPARITQQGVPVRRASASARFAARVSAALDPAISRSFGWPFDFIQVLPIRAALALLLANVMAYHLAQIIVDYGAVAAGHVLERSIVTKSRPG